MNTCTKFYIIQTEDGPMLVTELVDSDDIRYETTDKNDALKTYKEMLIIWEEKQTPELSEEDRRLNEGERLYEQMKEDT